MPKNNKGTVRELTRKDGSKVWSARFRYTDETGKQRERSEVVENKTAGYEWIASERDELKTTGKKAFSSKQTFQEFSDWYDAEYLKEAVRADNGAIVSGRKSLQPVKSQLKALQAFFGEMMIKEIDYHSLERYKAHRLNEPVRNTKGDVVMLADEKTGELKAKRRKPSTIRREMSLLSTILNKAKQQKLILRSPFNDGDQLFNKNVETERKRVLSRIEQDALLAACDVLKSGRHRQHIKPVILFAVNTGMRRGEILKMTWNLVDLNKGSMVLPSELTKTETMRDVPILAELLPILKELKARAKTEDARIFADVGDFRFSNIGDFKRSWATAKRIAGIKDLRFHDLRASFATRMIFENNVNRDAVRKVTGHKTDVFDRYLRPETHDLIKAFDGM